VPLCLLPIKSPSDFSCGLKVSHKPKSFLTMWNQQSPSCCHMVRAGLYNFRHVNFLFYASLVLTADKATVRFHRGMKCHTKHYSLSAIKSVSFSHHINRSSGHIFTDMGHLLRLLSCKVLHMHKGTDVLPVYRAYFDYMRVAGSRHHQFPKVRRP
jgi:hypothetical protein